MAKKQGSRSKKPEVEKNSIKSLISRYLLLILIALPGAWIFYKIFTPLTFYPIYFITGLFYDVAITSRISFIVSNSVPIELIGACIAGSAYYLLFILNLSTPGMKMKNRLSAIFFSVAVFLALNIIRIVILIFLAVTGSSYFDVTHLLFWYGLSTIIVVAIWFTEVKLFKIKETPFYSDLKFLYRASVLKR